jgi:hypothetical protein
MIVHESPVPFAKVLLLPSSEIDRAERGEERGNNLTAFYGKEQQIFLLLFDKLPLLRESDHKFPILSYFSFSITKRSGVKDRERG